MYVFHSFLWIETTLLPTLMKALKCITLGASVIMYVHGNMHVRTNYMSVRGSIYTEIWQSQKLRSSCSLLPTLRSISGSA